MQLKSSIHPPEQRSPTMTERKHSYDEKLANMSDNEVADEIAHWEDVSGAPGSFAHWALGAAERELDNRL